MKNKRKTEWVYGKHAVLAALNNPLRTVVKVIVTADLADWIKPFAEGAPIEKVTFAAVGQLVGSTAVHQGVAVLCEKMDLLDVDDVLNALDDQKNITLAVLDQVTDPQNIGSILRAAAAFGINALLLPDAHSPEMTNTIIKVSAGGYERVPVIRIGNLKRTLDDLKNKGFWIVGFAEGTKNNLSTHTFDQKSVVVFGAEGPGMRRLTTETCDVLLTLPTSKTFSTLNVAQAAAITFYEIFRQKGCNP